MAPTNLTDRGSYIPGPDFTGIPAAPIAPIGALEQWRTELRAGVGGQELMRPATWRRDELWAAACYEQEALTLAAEGRVVAAHACLRLASEAILLVQRARAGAREHIA